MERLDASHKESRNMTCPNISAADVSAIMPHARNIHFVKDGGQKRVFRAEIEGVAYAVKFLRPNVRQVHAEGGLPADSSVVDDVTARAKREVVTMGQCKTPYLVKLGPIGLTKTKVENEDLLYFTEEFIDGEALNDVVQRGMPIPVAELVRLGVQIAAAINELWSLKKIHRDIKPGNIMRRRTTGDFVLLDMGLVFDLEDKSYSLGPVGTVVYFSPEQVDFQNRRSVLDFRSDMFSLGLVLYEIATGQHPFFANAKNSWDVLRNIQQMKPLPPRHLRPDLPKELDDIILRLLGKRPALRYRKVSMLLEALAGVPI
jgi:serine/threonine protein kinase